MDFLDFSKQIRRNTLRCLHSQGSGHVGGSLSICDLLSVLYGKYMRVDATNPKRQDRDRLVLSKGHSGPALYATLALKGFFPMEWLDTLNKLGTNLPSHVNMNLTPGVDMTAGSLGQGLSAACGFALSQKMQSLPYYVYAIVGDGELQEGQNWEAIMFAGNKHLDNLIVFVDNNKMQIDGMTDEIMSLQDIESKFNSFGFATSRCNGHDHNAIDKAIQNAQNDNCGKPHCIVLDTIKGYGVSFYQNMGAGVHSTTVTDEQYENALKELI